MIRQNARMLDQEEKAKRLINIFKSKPSLIRQFDILTSNITAKPGDILEWVALDSLPFVRHRMMYLGNRQVVHPFVPGDLPFRAEVRIDSFDALIIGKTMHKYTNSSKIPFSRYRSIMNALHSVGDYAYCPISSNCQHIVASWQGFSNTEDAIGTFQVIGSLFLIAMIFLLIEYFADRLVFDMKKEVHQLPIFMIGSQACCS